MIKPLEIFDDPEANARWLTEEINDSLRELLANPSPPIDPNAPMPHWVKRSVQKTWIKMERERREALKPKDQSK